MDLHIIRFSSALVRFVRFFFSMKKFVPFRPHFHMSISALSRLSHTRPKYFEQKKNCKGVQPYFEISLLLVHTQNFYQHITFYLVRIWTNKNVDEKGHTFSWISKNGKNGQKQTKNGYCVNSAYE